MTKTVSAFELTLHARRPPQKIARWLYTELRAAILDGRLGPGVRLPASRDFASQYGLSRGTVVTVFERLQAEGYVSSGVGVGTWVNRVAPPVAAHPAKSPPAYVRAVVSGYVRPKPFVDLAFPKGIRPFRIGNPDVSHFPTELWGRIAARKARNFRSWLDTEEDGNGYRPLRVAIADYLRTSRGVRCKPEQVVVTSGIQQALYLLARLLLKQNDPMWMEDPGYFGATIAFEAAGAKIIPVPVDEEGLSVATGKKLCPRAKGVYLTPAHQFPFGVTLSLERRISILDWAARTGAFIIEDDYDSEYRFEGEPAPALQSLDTNSNVIFIGSFSKTLFPSLRMGYAVLPEGLVDYFMALRYRTDFRNSSFEQAILCDFIADGHLARHLRRMRTLYARRLTALIEGGKEHLAGVLEISNVRAGLYTIAFLKNGLTSRQAEKLAAAEGIEVLAVDRYTFRRPDPKALLIGFAAYDETTIKKTLIRLAKALG